MKVIYEIEHFHSDSKKHVLKINILLEAMSKMFRILEEEKIRFKKSNSPSLYSDLKKFLDSIRKTDKILEILQKLDSRLLTVIYLNSKLN
jgi:hypothetical protein